MALSGEARKLIATLSRQVQRRRAASAATPRGRGPRRGLFNRPQRRRTKAMSPEDLVQEMKTAGYYVYEAPDGTYVVSNESGDQLTIEEAREYGLKVRLSARAGMGTGYDPFDPANYKESKSNTQAYVHVDTISVKDTTKVARKFNLKVELVDEGGGGGGSAVGRVIGAEDDIARFLDHEHYDEQFHRIRPLETSRRPDARAGNLNSSADADSTLLEEILHFAQKYSDLGDAVQRQVWELADNHFDGLNANAVDLIEEKLGGFIDELDAAIADYKDFMGEDLDSHRRYDL